MLWQCRLCGSQNERTDAPCGVCGKGAYPRDAIDPAVAAGLVEPMGRRGVGAVITPGGAPPGPGDPLPPPPDKRVAAKPAAMPGATPAAPRRTGRRVFIAILVLLILIAIAVAIALASGAADSYNTSGAPALSMVLLPAARRDGRVHPPAEPFAGKPAPRERGGMRAS